ncbi:MAG TPA: RICIN domain-containing protein, partial [Hymenobacter sp.]
MSESYWYTAPKQQRYASQQRERWAIVRTDSDTKYIIADALTRAAIGFAGDNDPPSANVNGEIFHRIFRDLTIKKEFSHLSIVDVSTNSGVYTLTNLGSGKLLEVGGATEDQGARVQQWGKNEPNTAHQQWILRDLGTGYYTIVNRNSLQALEIGGDDAQVRTPGRHANQWPLSGADKQQWRLEYDPATSAYTLTNKASGYVLEIGGGDTSSNGVAANQWHGWGGQNQKWVLTYVGPN